MTYFFFVCDFIYMYDYIYYKNVSSNFVMFIYIIFFNSIYNIATMYYI